MTLVEVPSSCPEVSYGKNREPLVTLQAMKTFSSVEIW